MAIFDPTIYLEGARRAEREGAQGQQAIQSVIGMLQRREDIQREEAKQQAIKAEKEYRDPASILVKMQQGLPVTPEQQAIAQVYAATKVNPVTGENVFSLGGRPSEPAMRPMVTSLDEGAPLTPKGRLEAEKLQMEEQFDIRKEAREQERSRSASRKSLDKAFTANRQTIMNLDKNIDKAIKMTGRTTAGLGGSALGFIPGTEARDLQRTLESIQADAAFGTLQQMRDASPTGGALGSVSERELALLQNARTALDADQSPEQLKQNLETYRDLRRQALSNVADAYKQDFGEYPSGFKGYGIEKNSEVDLTTLSDDELMKMLEGM